MPPGPPKRILIFARGGAASIRATGKSWAAEGFDTCCDFRCKLGPDTIETLNLDLAEILDGLDYPA
jgi:hypothetical protein